MTKKIKVAVVAINANGVPDFFRCVIECSQAEIDNGDHYDKAMKLAEDANYEPRLAIDEHDSAWSMLKPLEGEDELPVWLHGALNEVVGVSGDELNFLQIVPSVSMDLNDKEISGFWFDASYYVPMEHVAQEAYQRITFQFGEPTDKQGHQMLHDLVQDCGKRHGGKVQEEAEDFYDDGSLLEAIEFLLKHDGVRAIADITAFVNPPDEPAEPAPGM